MDPALDIYGAHRCHRFADDRGGELAEEGRNQQHKSADFFERAAGGEGFVDEGTGTHRIINSSIDGTDAILVDESQQPLDRPDFSSDGRYIAYAALKDGDWDSWIAEADGSAKHRVTSDLRMETNPLWKPQGLAVSFKMAPTAGEYNLTEQYFMTFENGLESPTVHQWGGV